MFYEVSNPSDKVTLEADDEKIAQIACLLVGEGKFGLTDEEGKDVLPIFLFGGAEEWLKEHDLDPLNDHIDEKALEIVSVLRTFMIADFADRRAIKTIIDMAVDRRKALEAWDDEHRTSMNRICEYAYGLADRLEEMAEKKSSKDG